MKSIKELIVLASNERTDIPPFFLIDAEILGDGTLWFSYSYSEEVAKEQKSNTEGGLLEGTYDELICASEEMYREAAHYIALRSQEAEKGEAE